MAAFAVQAPEGLEGHVGVVLTWLLEGLGGRTWEGKEELVEAVASMCKECTAAVDKEAVGGKVGWGVAWMGTMEAG